MTKKIFIINGSGGVGKDTFVGLVSIALNDKLKRFHTVDNYSSVDKVKEIASEIGWDGKKEERDRKFLSDLKELTSNYCDMPFNCMVEKVEEFRKDEETVFLFLHIREPQEIERAKNEFDANTILIRRNSVKHITTNIADGNVFNYEYDITINNDGDLKAFGKKAKKFVEKYYVE